MFVDRKLAENGLVKVMFAPYTKTATAIFDPQVALKSSIKILLEFLVLYIKKTKKKKTNLVANLPCFDSWFCISKLILDKLKFLPS